MSSPMVVEIDIDFETRTLLEQPKIIRKQTCGEKTEETVKTNVPNTNITIEKQ